MKMYNQLICLMGLFMLLVCTFNADALKENCTEINGDCYYGPPCCPSLKCVPDSNSYTPRYICEPKKPIE